MTPLPTAHSNDAGVVGLHHVGMLVEDLSSAAAFYCDAFGYTIESAIIEDTTQTARLQFFRLPGGQSWLELISPLGADSKLANSLKKNKGLHHLCFEVADIVVSVEQLRARGMFPVGLPTPAVAFAGRKIAWFMDWNGWLFEMVETGGPPLSLKELLASEAKPKASQEPT